MKAELIDLPVKAVAGAPERASVTALHARADGTLWCGLCFASPALMLLTPDSQGKGFSKTEDFEIETFIGPSFVGITHGLRATESGDTAFGVWQTGMLPAFAQRLLGQNYADQHGPALLNFMHEQTGGVGAFARHAVVQIMDHEIKGRRYKESGLLLDVAHTGDFIFGLSGSSIWREPYLNTEKRETLRSDLVGNAAIHRDYNGVMWFLGKNGRLLRLNQTDIKAKPTPLKLPEDNATNPGFRLSAASKIDDWLYGVTEASNTLFRVRLNSVSGEEELQVITKLDARVSAMCVIENDKGSKLVIATEGRGAAEFYAAELVAAADPEMTESPPLLKSIGSVAGIECVGSLTVDANGIVWGGESRLGCGVRQADKLRLIRLVGL